ncbi:MAG: hypothetical protein A3D65_01475 [Candidatus Lloydbacteria bacterium RIFCSPHIGHO2_02_FULL_50_13]|uniref:N-acetyltransferase domain-containing protein n=1 Tax=Candidatus Lloydbacteria bacterium RIFCSPHIGHO2_02_FULL_50_13 TaxID=1798661 RepID=A0A1G2D2A0_9BACT|nr:MAG: hypothetical protein A3D65_01475 [Candidatus Lloydbacteria bacterium RIFCSPHIGHO2_02_FULL_50_13]
MSAEEPQQIQYISPKEALEQDESPQHRLDLFVNGEKIGSAEIDYFSKPLPLYQLSDLYVFAAHHSKGYGSQIMEQVEAWLKERKKPGVLVDAIEEDEAAHGMYARRGWQKVPHSCCLHVFNWPKKISLDILRTYPLRYTDHTERKGFVANEASAIKHFVPET